jgi:photosystem II stability/assembly factor-like uncharacterized protein
MHSKLKLLCLIASVFACVLSTSAQQPKLSWQMQDSGTTAGLRGIDTFDGKIAWASGTQGAVLKTTDGGTHWTKCAVPDSAIDGATLDFRGVQAWDAQNAIVMASGPGNKSRLYKTTDGCMSWTLLFKNPDTPDGFFDSVSVANEDTIMLVGDPVGGQFSVFNSDDGGKTWNKDYDPGLQSQTKEGAFAASNSSLVINWADGPAAFGTGGPFGARLYLQCDACNKKPMWTAHRLPSFPRGEGAGVFSLNFRDWHRLVAVGGDYTKSNEGADTAAYSTDAGVHWTAAVKPPHGYRSSVQWSDDLKAWITVGTNGSDISRDDGKTWTPLDNGNWNALSLPFVVGPKGRIARLSVSSAK